MNSIHSEHSAESTGHLKQSACDYRASVARQVDRYLLQAIEFLLIEQPSDEKMLPTLHDFLRTASTRDRSDCRPTEGRIQKISLASRLLFARRVGPIVSRLIDESASSCPTDVPTFLATIVEGMLTERNSFAKRLGLCDLAKSGLACSGSHLNIQQPGPKEANAKRLTILVIGLDGAGKSTLIALLKGQKHPKCNPTRGFNPVLMKMNKIEIQFYDIGGGDKIRGIWEEYFPDVHGVIYVIDAASSEHKFEQSIFVAKKTLRHKCIQKKPLLVLCNKLDKPDARDIRFMKAAININTCELVSTKIFGTSVYPKQGALGGCPDPKIEKKLEWLIERILNMFHDLSQRVRSDKKKALLEMQQKQISRERSVMKKMICKAFGAEKEEARDTFDKNEGETFLAAEIGVENRKLLPTEAVEVAALIGYQKYGLMIVGRMVAPLSTEKKKWEWSEVKQYIQDLRDEIKGLPLVSV